MPANFAGLLANVAVWVVAAGYMPVWGWGYWWIFWEIDFSFSRRLLWWDVGLHQAASCVGVLASSGGGSVVAGEAGGIAV
jgi:hypothetical protein